MARVKGFTPSPPLARRTSPIEGEEGRVYARAVAHRLAQLTKHWCFRAFRNAR